MTLESFTKVFGHPDRPARPGLQFRTPHWQRRWDSIYSVTGAGWFLDGFLYLFGEGLDVLSACIDAWSFLVPHSESRMVVGRNAYGALLVLENTDDVDTQCVYVLDPFTVTYAQIPNAHLVSLIGRILPRRDLPTFFDDGAYRSWLAEHHVDHIELGDVLGIKQPRALGGSLASDNLQIEDIVEYYRSTGPIYAAAFATLKPSQR